MRDAPPPPRPRPRPPEPKGRLPKGARGDVGASTVPYTDPEREVLAAVDAWKRRTGKRFPAVTEVFAIVLALGYRKEGGG